MRPLDPGPCRWELPQAQTAGRDELLGVGADLEPATILHAYRTGLFPMPTRAGGPIGWWSPLSRGVLPIDAFRVSRSLRRSISRFEIRFDTAFDEVVTACADPARTHGWIDDRIHAAYRKLHDMGWVHSVEAWDDDGLAGGLYGVAIGGLFAGESMFHRRTDASKVALHGLMQALDDGHRRLVDTQWRTPHLESLGVQEVSRAGYLASLPTLLESPQPSLMS